MSLPHIKLADVLFAHRNIVTYGDAVRIAKAIEQLTKQNSSTADMMFEEAWIGIANVLSDIDPDWGVGEGRIMDRAVNFIRLIAEQRNACQAQQRENAETIKALTERAETAEAANTELDNARKSAEQSARDLRENNATLRAELDAIKGAQVPYRWTVVGKDRMSFTFTSLGSAQTWANGEGGEVIPLYRHPAPVLPVVGACVVRDGEVAMWGHNGGYKQENCERSALKHASWSNGTAHQLLLGAPLPTEGGK